MIHMFFWFTCKNCLYDEGKHVYRCIFENMNGIYYLRGAFLIASNKNGKSTNRNFVKFMHFLSLKCHLFNDKNKHIVIGMIVNIYVCINLKYLLAAVN